MERTERIVLKDKDAETKLCAMSVDHFWDLVEMVKEDPSQGVGYELHFSAYQADVSIHYVVDPIAECSYVIVSGQNMADASALVRDKIAHWIVQELFEAWDALPHDSERILAILRIGVAAPFDYDERFAKTLRQGLTDENAEVREATLAAIGYRDWSALDTDLREVAKDDREERCRNRALAMLEIRKGQRASQPGVAQRHHR